MGNNIYKNRRYLVNFNSESLPQMFTDSLVVGSGVAGLYAAIEAANHGQVLLITKKESSESNTSHAQGGVAVVLKTEKEDSVEAHINDTLTVGCGLCDSGAVRTVISNGPDCISELIEWGAGFDLKNGKYEMGREAGHSAFRIIHAQGDATGREISRSLIAKAKTKHLIKVMEYHYMIDILTEEGRCLGVLVYNDAIGLHLIRAKQTILATGGCGRIYQETTNPEVATGDGLAMAWRAGAELQDMEMMQFHPTTLYIAGSSRALISEAVRGEGAYLIDINGYRFMSDYHKDGELAPRDIVSRSIMQQIIKTGSRFVYLDARHIPFKEFSSRFPHITEQCSSFGIDVAKDPIPVRPSAHYMVGGIKVDLQARTNIEGLYACGEVSCTGLHGANRLASNSLLEGMVFGKIAGQNAGKWIDEHPEPIARVPIHSSEKLKPAPKALDLQDLRTSLRTMLWRHVGIKRDGEHLKEALSAITTWGTYVLGRSFSDPSGWETQNMLTSAWNIARFALKREESRGVHYREDFPDTDDKNWKKHITDHKDSDSV